MIKFKDEYNKNYAKNKYLIPIRVEKVYSFEKRQGDIVTIYIFGFRFFQYLAIG